MSYINFILGPTFIAVASDGLSVDINGNVVNEHTQKYMITDNKVVIGGIGLADVSNMLFNDISQRQFFSYTETVEYVTDFLELFLQECQRQNKFFNVEIGVVGFQEGAALGKTFMIDKSRKDLQIFDNPTFSIMNFIPHELPFEPAEFFHLNELRPDGKWSFEKLLMRQREVVQAVARVSNTVNSNITQDLIFNEATQKAD